MASMRPPFRMSTALVMVALLVWSAAPSFALPKVGDNDKIIDLIKKLGEADAAGPRIRKGAPTQAEIEAAAKTIDGYIDMGIKKANEENKDKQISPTKRMSDTAFLRRAYLDIAGRIPSVTEVLEYRKMGSNKRAKLINKLLKSEAYVSHNFNYWADVFRIRSDQMRAGEAWMNWMKEQLRQNKPWDQVAYDMITAEGFPWDNGAVGFYLRDEGMPLDHMALSVQTFLGTSLVCAQCHDHPFDLWTQYEFYEMAAFTYGVDTRARPENVEKARKMIKDRDVRRALDDLTRDISYGLTDTDRKVQLPHDYKYDDAKPFQVVKPKAILGGSVLDQEADTLRQKYAKWIIGRENPRFTLTIANRMWKKVMGIGLIEPVDEMTLDSVPTNPKLMAFLAFKMKDFNYDLQAFQAMLYNTQTYQREALTVDHPAGEPFYYHGYLLKRMTAEQFWDSLMTLIVPDIDYRPGPATNAYIQQYAFISGASPSELVSRAEAQAKFNKEETRLRNEIAKAREKKDDQKVRELNAELRKLRNENRQSMMAMMNMGNMSEGEYAQSSRPRKTNPAWSTYNPGYVRASELRSPERFGHFLQMFGQGSRETANNFSLEPNMLQVLAMFNGGMFDQVMKNDSQLMKYVGKSGSPRERIEIVFQSVYNRKPSSYELDVVVKAIHKPNGTYEYARIVWALLNTREFSFVR